MINKKSQDIFRNHFFDGLLEEEINNIDIELFKEVNYSPGEMLIKQDTIGDFMILIVKGEVIISKEISNTDVELARRYDNEYVGEMALFDNQLRSANVVANTNVYGYLVTLEHFISLFNSFEQIKINLIKIISSTVRDTGCKLGQSSIKHNKQLLLTNSELNKTRSLLQETIELKRFIDEQKCELELINRELEKRNKELYQLSIMDDLTHLYSKNHFNTLLESEFSKSLRYSIFFSILLIDIDDFNEFNLKFGHFTGDRFLKEAAGTISKLAKSEDVIGRISGEKFGIILPHQTIDEAKILASDIIKEIENDKFTLNGQSFGVTVSIGITDNTIGEPNNVSELLENLESSLQKAKASGKNRLEIFS